MTRAACRREVIAAQYGYVVERGRWRSRTLALRACIAPHRVAWTIGGGLAGGFLTGLLPIRSAARAVNLVMGTLSFALHGPIGTALRAWSRNDDASTSDMAQPTPPPP